MNNRLMEPAQKERTPFADIDGLTAQMSEIVLDALTEMGRHSEIRRVRRVAFDKLRPAAGQCLLDAGSGAGEDSPASRSGIQVHQGGWPWT